METLFYELKSDNYPLPLDFLKTLSSKIKARFLRYLVHIEENDGKIAGIAFRKLHDYPLEEIRIKESKKLHRLILHIKINNTIYILHWFTKKEWEKTPIKELDIAYQRLLNLIS